MSLINKGGFDLFRTTCIKSSLKNYSFSSLNQPLLSCCRSGDSGSMHVAIHTAAHSASGCAWLGYNCAAIKSLANVNNLHVIDVHMTNFKTAVIYRKINSNKDFCVIGVVFYVW